MIKIIRTLIICVTFYLCFAKLSDVSANFCTAHSDAIVKAINNVANEVYHFKKMRFYIGTKIEKTPQKYQ